jgi:hypothetical protein
LYDNLEIIPTQTEGILILNGNNILNNNVPHTKDLRFIMVVLTPKGRSPFFGPFLKFGQAIVDAIFVQKTSNFW